MAVTKTLGVAQLLEPDKDAPAFNSLSLFWRTFVLLTLLLIGSIAAWTQTLLELESEPRAVQTARQIASVVNLSRAAVKHSDAITRVALFKTMKDQEHLGIALREPGDVVTTLTDHELNHYIIQELRHRLGPDTVVASHVNNIPGLWIGFTIDKDQFWLQTDLERFEAPAGRLWLVWLLTAVVLSLAGAAWIARLVTSPLKNLSFATNRVREGDFEASVLDESVSTNEIRAVNVGFNRMTQRLAKIEQDRAVMLAGISHDLRTPLARVRLEAELSVADPKARENISADIEQLDSIINKFLDYARPGDMLLSPVSLNDMVDTCVMGFRKRDDMVFKIAMESGLLVLADPVELQRVLTNLVENAGRYGKSVDTGVAMVDISARYQEKWVLLRIRDHGCGVDPAQLKQLKTPFYRGEAARTAAQGAGLGLAIVDKTVSRMGGAFELSNASSGGLCSNIQLQRATAPRNSGF
jgi:two-component system osmolarity sensor histidine kinase EnvZ